MTDDGTQHGQSAGQKVVRTMWDSGIGVTTPSNIAACHNDAHSAQDKEHIHDDPSLTIGLKTSRPRVLMQAMLKRM